MNVVARAYDWLKGAPLEDHTRRKHKILKEYFKRYLAVRCRVLQQTKFRLAVVDGFAGGGRYACGSPGSPLIFVEELRDAVASINSHRVANGFPLVEIECLLVLNDADPEVVKLLQSNCAPLLVQIKADCPQLHIQPMFFAEKFEGAYPQIKRLIEDGRYRNVMFNLDQCGHSLVTKETLFDIMRLAASVEVFYTFAIQSLLAFLHTRDPHKLADQLRHLEIAPSDLLDKELILNNGARLGLAEKVVFEAFGSCARFVSPFSINNPNGWRYWLLHFANSHRARQVYTDVLHDNADSQAHFGRSGLNMLSYDPAHEGALYLFDMSGREAAKKQLVEDIPRMIEESGDAMVVEEFYENIYNATPAHKDDIHAAMITCEDLEVLTPTGGARRQASTIEVGDTIRMKRQRSFFPIFFNKPK